MKIETPRIWLPRTGQTTSFADGDDGDLQAGNPRATRFVAMAAENLTMDRHTGLTWVTDPRLIIPGGPAGSVYKVQVAEGVWSNATDYVVGDLVQGDGDPDALFYVCVLANGPGGVGAKEPPDATYWVQTVWTDRADVLTGCAHPAWADAVADCLGLDYAGYQDWRLPNAAELFSLIDWESRAWQLFPADLYGVWSSTTKSAVTTYAWRVYAASSSPLAAASKTDTANYAACPVRGGRING